MRLDLPIFIDDPFLLNDSGVATSIQFDIQDAALD